MVGRPRPAAEPARSQTGTSRPTAEPAVSQPGTQEWGVLGGGDSPGNPPGKFWGDPRTPPKGKKGNSKGSPKAVKTNFVREVLKRAKMVSEVPNEGGKGVKFWFKGVKRGKLVDFEGSEHGEVKEPLERGEEFNDLCPHELRVHIPNCLLNFQK